MTLLSRLAAAEGPDRELDIEINLEVFALVSLPDAPDFTGSIDTAKMLVPAGHTYAVGDCGEEDCPWACVTSPADGYKDFAADAATEPLALCIAALRARGIGG